MKDKESEDLQAKIAKMKLNMKAKLLSEKKAKEKLVAQLEDMRKVIISCQTLDLMSYTHVYI